jgi:DNA-binding NarL/FixJ family response regulator
MGAGTNARLLPAWQCCPNRSEGGSVQELTNIGLAARRGKIIRVAVVDDHAAIRSGLKAVIASEPGLACVGLVADGEQLAPLMYSARPGVVVLDYHLTHSNGLLLCRQVKSDVLAPAVIVYSAFADAALVIPAIVAGADGLVDKTAPARELLTAIRCVSQGGASLPRAMPELLHAARDMIDATDIPILELLVQRAPHAQIASQLAIERAAVERRIDRMLARLCVPVAPRRQPSQPNGAERSGDGEQ